jgi:asparaginyl-tRNA synthetase
MGLGSDSLPVRVNLFGVDTYLADSMQFALEYGCRIAEEGAFYIMPSFRGESPDETHLSQFFHSEAEIPGTLEDVMELVESYLMSLTNMIVSECGEGLGQFVNSTDHIENFLNRSGPIPRISFDSAVELLDRDPRYVRECAKDALTLTRAGERRLMEIVSPVLWVTHFHHQSVPFYQAKDPTNPKCALAADLLMGPGEVVGCGQRHSTREQTLESLRSHSVNASDYEWYVTMKGEFPLQTAGFGLGIERFMMWLLKHGDIRDFQLMPRANGVNIIP